LKKSIKYVQYFYCIDPTGEIFGSSPKSIIISLILTIKNIFCMKAILFFLVILISLLAGRVKADTIHYQLPGGAQICQDSLNFDTFVFHKPLGFGSTMWYIDATYLGSGDSIIFNPTAFSDYVISSTWNSNVQSFMLSIYTAPPVHADFANDGIDGVDTLYRCGEHITVSSNLNPNGEYSQLYQGPNGYSIHNHNPVVVTDPGMYFYTRENACGVTVDSFFVMVPNTTLPVFTDTTFCNATVNLLLDATPGFIYLWSDGSTSQEKYVSTEGTYSVTVNNACVSGTATSVVEHESYPLPDLAVYSQNANVALCHDQVAFLDPNPNYTYDSYDWYRSSDWISDQATLTIDYASVINAGGNGFNYYLTVSVGNCISTSNSSVNYHYVEPYMVDHCVSTFDPITGKNKTVFQHDIGFELIGYVLMYKQGSNWLPIDTLAYSYEGGWPIPQYILWDSVHDPNQQSFTYAILPLHNCGFLGDVENWHKTIRIGIFQDVISQDYILQLLDDYTTMNGYEPESYTIWIDSLNNGDFAEIGILNGGNASFTIPSPVNGAAYYASVNLPWDCDESRSGNFSYSNRKVFIITDIPTIDLGTSGFYPNPSDGIFNLAKPVASIEVFNISGQLVASFSNTEIIDLSGYPAGVYRARISNGLGSTNRTLVLQ
jgi:hypothetical protein